MCGYRQADHIPTVTNGAPDVEVEHDGRLARGRCSRRPTSNRHLAVIVMETGRKQSPFSAARLARVCRVSYGSLGVFLLGKEYELPSVRCRH